jgi:WD40 repeat protein
LGTIDGAPVIVSGSHDNTIRRWNALTGGPIGKPLEGHRDKVTSVVFGVIDSAPVIISGSWDNTVRRWDARTGECNQCLAIGESTQAIDMDDNNEVLVGLDRGIVLFKLLTMPHQ